MARVRPSHTRLIRTAALSLSIVAGGVLAAPAVGSAASSTYVVEAGDTLVGIARSHGVALQALLDANGLGLSSLIVPGQQLTIPDPAAAAVPSGETYTVVAGDSLGGIARAHGVTLGALLKVNGMSASSLIIPGQELQLPLGASATPAARGSSGAGTQWVSTGDAQVDRVLNFALAQLGKRYVFFTKGASTFDCSGLTLAAYAQAGVSLVHHAATQATQGTAVDFWNHPIRAGDLVFLDGDWDGTIDHVGMAINNSSWVHASQTRREVVISPMPSDSVIIAVRRYV
jgi:LysM repeat protein